MQLFYDVQGSPVPISQLEKGPGAERTVATTQQCRWHGTASSVLVGFDQMLRPSFNGG